MLIKTLNKLFQIYNVMNVDSILEKCNFIHEILFIIHEFMKIPFSWNTSYHFAFWRKTDVIYLCEVKDSSRLHTTHGINCSTECINLLMWISYQNLSLWLVQKYISKSYKSNYLSIYIYIHTLSLKYFPLLWEVVAFMVINCIEINVFDK